ncbi:MAG: hypothetical protein E7H10_04220 [Lactococcus lactis]|nr:hypothetical protein [Lactococcus lactis]
MKINNFTKCTLAVALGFGLNSLAVVQATNNNAETPASDKINKSFIEQFPFAEKFTDKDGITAVRMKSPDVPLVNKEKGYSKEVVRVINYKQGAAGTVINRIYQYVRFYGAPVHEVPKDSPVNDVPEYNGGANPIDPPVLEKPEYNGGANPIDPPVLEKPEYNGGANPIDPPILEKPEYNDGANPIDPPVLEKPEYNGGANPIDPPILEKPELKVPNTPEKPKIPGISTPEKPKTDTPNNLPKPNPKENNPQNNNKVLPNTGLETNSSIAIIGTLALSIFGLAI